MPPEQMSGERIGPPADVFAVGALLVEAWSGKAPFRRKKIEEVEAALVAPHPKPSDVDPRLIPVDLVIGRALDLDPAKRPQQAEELGRALRKFLMGTDSGDIARALGDRVKEVRAKAQRDREVTEPESAEVKPRAPSAPDLVTKTFAARDEVKSWSEHPPPATRKLVSSAPPGTEDAPIETLATRPIETPVEKPKKKPPAPVASPSRARWIAGGLGVVALAGAAYFARGTWGTQAVPQASVSTGPSLIATLVPSTSPSTSPASSAPRTAAAPSVSVAPPSLKQAHLALYGDPGTRVRVDGAAWSTCPVKDYAVDPGEHDVRFFFEPSGESPGRRVTLRDGEKVSLRADFTGVVPTITVSR
jgi:serine/threonine protein kinase